MMREIKKKQLTKSAVTRILNQTLAALDEWSEQLHMAAAARQSRPSDSGPDGCKSDSQQGAGRRARPVAAFDGLTRLRPCEIICACRETRTKPKQTERDMSKETNQAMTITDLIEDPRTLKVTRIYEDAVHGLGIGVVCAEQASWPELISDYGIGGNAVLQLAATDKVETVTKDWERYAIEVND